MQSNHNKINKKIIFFQVNNQVLLIKNLSKIMVLVVTLQIREKKKLIIRKHINKIKNPIFISNSKCKLLKINKKDLFPHTFLKILHKIKI